MKIKISILFAFLFSTVIAFSQKQEFEKKINVSGKVIEKTTQQPLEYVTISFIEPNSKKTAAVGISNAKGEFKIEVKSGTYNVVFEYISFKSFEIKNRNFDENTQLETISLEDATNNLKEVVIKTEKAAVEFKLDKKIYNVGSDITVKGGTVSDVLDNIPSVAVDSDGNVSLRGNDKIRILIDGKPSNAINISETLKQIPADAIEKVEVISNPSARYDAEGGGGLLNIILKKGRNKGMNGSVTSTIGNPDNFGLSGTMNYKLDKFNFFTTSGYNYRVNQGNAKFENEYLNADNTVKNYIFDNRHNSKVAKGFNSNIGMEWYIFPTTTWTNTVNWRENIGDNPDHVRYDYYDQNKIFQSSAYRLNGQYTVNNFKEYTTNFTKRFKKDGHKFSIDGTVSTENDNTNSIISFTTIEGTKNNQKQDKSFIQMDYVYPFGKGSQFETGYKGDFNTSVSDYEVGSYDALNQYTVNTKFTNTLEYKENINAVYAQIGSKIQKISYLLGLRWEDSKININELISQNFNTQKYNYFFPSAFLTYEISQNNSLSLNYSRRINRPRGRMINPFSNYSSNINVFQGNPKLFPSITDVVEMSYLKKWSQLTLNTSAYFNKSMNVNQIIRKENGDFVNGTPVIITTPINLADEFKYGMEFTLNYSPFKWWKLNTNVNFFNLHTLGEYTYIDYQNNLISQKFDNRTISWTTRLTSKVTLPYKIDWQTNATYNAPQNYVQGTIIGIFAFNLGFSKDVFKDKGTIALNVQDVLNSRKRIFETHIDGVLNSYSAIQMKVRQINLSFTYRFNRQKSEKEKLPKGGGEGGGEEF